MPERSSREQIEHLMCEYSERVDSGNLEGVADLLKEAAFGTEADPLLRGRDLILRVYRKTVRLYEDGTPRTKHVLTNVDIEVDEDARRASAKSYWTVLQAVSGRIVPILSGRYRDRFEWRDGEWIFTERRIITDLFGEISNHMLAGSEQFLEG
jgi:SnoaL-like domain